MEEAVIHPEVRDHSEFGPASEVHYALAAFEQSSGHALRDRGMKLRHYDLMLALKTDGKCAQSMREISRRLGVRSHVASETLFQLARRNLVRVRRDANNRRKLALELTDRGERLLQELSLEEQQQLQTFGPALLTGLKDVLDGVGRRTSQQIRFVASANQERSEAMGKTEIQRFRQKLESRREEALQSLSRLGIETRTLDIDSPQDSGDQSILNFSKESLFQRGSQRRHELRMIETALERMREGTFGICDACGKQIQPRRLQALPWTQYCLGCQERMELREKLASERPAMQGVADWT
jgi:RNA polymerase-binding transcription factor